jgi:hypothetical protein
MSKDEKAGNGIYFDRINYIFLVGGILLVALGYILMIGGKSEDPNVFNPKIFSTQRITVAPITCLIGFAALVYAIMRRPKTPENQEH